MEGGLTMIDLRTAAVRNSMVFSPVITPRTTVATALRLLREHGLDALPVCDGDRLLGLVRETGLLRLTPSDMTTLDVYELRTVLDGITVSRIIESVPAISADATLEDAAVLMRTGRHEVLPVVDGGRFAGLLPWTAVLP
jgi:acetoin utilization protein AcuB